MTRLFHKLVIAGFLVGFMSIGGSVGFIQPAFAQSYAPVAIVNDIPVTGYDLDQRVRLMSALLGVDPTPAQRQEMGAEALQGLIDEKLQKQAAEQGNVKVPEDQMKGFRDRFIQQARMNESQFTAFLNSRGIEKSTFDTFVESQARWNALVVSQFARKISISDSDVMKIAERIASSAQVKARLSEIFVPIDGAADEQKAQGKMMSAMNALKAGEPFGTIASRLSESPSRSNHGELGWVSLGQIDPQLAQEITNRPAGSIIGPMRSEKGIHLLYLHEKRQDDSDKQAVQKDKDGSFNLAPELRQKIEDQLFQEELALQARRYLQNLRQNATLSVND